MDDVDALGLDDEAMVTCDDDGDDVDDNEDSGCGGVRGDKMLGVEPSAENVVLNSIECLCGRLLPDGTNTLWWLESAVNECRF